MGIAAIDEMDNHERNENDGPALCAACEGAALCGVFRNCSG